MIHTETISLVAFLKWAQLAESGGRAKRAVQSGRVSVNGAVERHRSRRLAPGDRVAMGGRAYEVVSELPGDVRGGARKR